MRRKKREKKSRDTYDQTERFRDHALPNLISHTFSM